MRALRDICSLAFVMTSVQVMWRYTCLYVTERCYESGGRLWDQVSDIAYLAPMHCLWQGWPYCSVC